jgi:hypothetical protein
VSESTGIWIRHEVLKKDLPPAETMILAMITEMQPFYATNRYIAERLHITHRSITSKLAYLQEKGFIKITGLTSSRVITIENISIDTIEESSNVSENISIAETDYRKNCHSTIEKIADTLEKNVPTIENISTNIKDNKDKKEDNKDKPKKVKPKKHKYGEYSNVLLSSAEYEKLLTAVDDRDKWIRTLDEGIALKGYSYKSHYLAILKWYKNGNGVNHHKVNPIRLPEYRPPQEITEEERLEGQRLLDEAGGIENLLKGKLKNLRRE